MNRMDYRLGGGQLLVLYCGMVALLLLAMHYRQGPELADDGAFFLRYAENMLKGEFWVWNPGEAPVWGASAPFFPLIIALPMALGLPPETAIVGVSLAVSAASLAALALMIGQRFGSVAGAAFLAFAAAESTLMSYSGAGLETPVTVALIVFALWTVWHRPSTWVVGLAAGLLMVHKLDLIPVGGLLLLAHWIQDRRFPMRAALVAGGLGLAWYLFAWAYFGAPVPNSFLTKSIHQASHPKSIDWTWFGAFVFGAGINKWLAVFSIAALWAVGRQLLPLVVLLAGTVVVHLVAYTVKYPFEPYNWYAMPAVLSLLVLGSIGVARIGESIGRRIPRLGPATAMVGLVIAAVAVFASLRSELNIAAHIRMFLSHHEYDRAEAGRWVARNTPEDFVVYTMWGNPAYYSQRKVLDGSFLNRPFEPGNLVDKYRPEILILQNNPGSTPMNPVFASTRGENYRVVKVFDKTYLAGMDYFFAVLAREDVLDKIGNVDVPRDLMRYVRDAKLGDQVGLLAPRSQDTLFIHPGFTTPTEFRFLAPEYLRESGQKSIHLHARMAPNVPAEAVRRGGANVRLRVLEGDRVRVDAIVKVGEPMQKQLSVTGGVPLYIVVDSNGGADTDWLHLSIK